MPPTTETFLPQDYEDPVINEIISGLSSVFTLPLFLILTFGIQFVGVDIIEEKSSKAIETIISSVKASIHFLSKIIASLIFILIQSILLVIYGLIEVHRCNQSTSVTDVNRISNRSICSIFPELAKYTSDYSTFHFNWCHVIFSHCSTHSIYCNDSRRLSNVSRSNHDLTCHRILYFIVCIGSRW